MTRRVALGGARRRGVVAVMVAICMVVLLGFAALAIDVGAMYNARGDLQRSADAAALAAAAVLSEYDTDDPVSTARATARKYVELNPAMGKGVTVAPDDDVTFLRSRFSAAQNMYSFSPTESMPDAVRVTVRMSEDSPNGPLQLFFAGIFGRNSTEVSASAVAGMVPRDIALVADLSASHTDDSELRKYRSTAINLYDVWSALPGGFGDLATSWDVAPPSNDLRQAQGPAWGFMKTLGYGTLNLDRTYNPASDPGLVYLPYRQNWTNTQLVTYLTEQQYSPSEITAIMQSGASDSTSTYSNRVAVALGLATWNSGMPGGRWSKVGLTAGNGNSTINESEIAWRDLIMGRSATQTSPIWNDYIGNYMTSTNNTMYQANSAFRYRFGIKTFINYLLEERPEPLQTLELAKVPTQPMQAVKEAIGHMMNELESLESQDRISLEVYSTIGVHEVDLTSDFSRVSTRLSEMQAAHYGHYTNIGAGLERAIEELSSSRARSGSKKVIVLYTDGVANINKNGQYNLSGAKQYAWDMAQEAAERGFRIYAVSVGSEPDMTFMDRIAELGDGEHFHAEGSIQQYSAQLTKILNRLSSERSVQLLE